MSIQDCDQFVSYLYTVDTVTCVGSPCFLYTAEHFTKVHQHTMYTIKCYCKQEPVIGNMIVFYTVYLTSSS